MVVGMVGRIWEVVRELGGGEEGRMRDVERNVVRERGRIGGCGGNRGRWGGSLEV